MTPAVPAHDIVEALFAHAPLGIGFWDADLRYRRVNAELAAMNGFPPEEHIGFRPSELLPELGPRLEEIFARIVQSGEPLLDTEISGKTPAAPDLTRHWLASYFPVHDEGGGVVGLMATVIEVTREREAGQFIDAELRALYGALPVGVAFLTPDLRYQRVNETLARLNGRSVEAHLGASVADILPGHEETIRTALQTVIDNREPLHFDVTVPLPADPDRHVTLDATYFPVTDPDGRLLGVGGVIIDVTQRRALEVEQARLLKEAEAGRRRIAFLAAAGARLAESVEWEATLHAVVHSAVPDVADWSSLTVVERNGALRVAAIAHTDPQQEQLAWEMTERYPRPDEDNQTMAVIRSGEMFVMEDIPHEVLREAAQDERHLQLLESLDMRHAVIVPLQTPAGALGALTFVLSGPDRRFAPEDLTLIQSLASRAALHLQNARLFRERSHVAETLQASLRPRGLPEIPGVELAARFLPAGDVNGVGGDFYDVFATGEGAWTVIVGDVAGKGPEAAAITATARHTLRTASLLGQEPAACLGILNRALYADIPRGNLCTTLYLCIQPHEDHIEITYANAGHPPPLLVRAAGELEELSDGRGPIAGAAEEVTFREGSARLGPGDLLLLYTDGVTEVSTRHLERGEQALRAALRQTAGAQAADVVAAVERRAVELQGGARRDDIALLALRAS